MSKYLENNAFANASVIADMSNEAAQQILETLCLSYFSGGSWRSNFARAIDMQPRTVTKWMQPDNRPPTWAIILMKTLTTEREYRATLSQLGTALKTAMQIEPD